MAKKIRVWDGSAWQDVAPALPYTAVHSAQASMPLTAVDGQIWLDTDASVPSTSVTRWYKLPASGTTTLSGNDDNSIPLAYTPGYEQVFLNGTLLSRSAADYTATTGTSVVLSSAIVAGDIVEIICPLQITTTDTYTQSAVNAAFQANTNNFAAGKNKLINGDFNINQRNFTSTTTDGTYGFDRWIGYFQGGTTTYSAQTFTTGTAPVAGYEGKNYPRLVTTSQSSAGDFASVSQKIESVRSFAGQTVTFSFWAKASTGTPNIGVGFSQFFGLGGSPSAEVITSTAVKTITSSWARYSFTVAIPSIAGKTIGTTTNTDFLQAWIFTSCGTTISSLGYPAVGLQNVTVDIWGVQVEAGSNATAFQTATGTIQGELAACQRYYYRANAQTTSYYISTGTGFARNTTIAYIPFFVPVTMRAISSLDYSGIRAVRASTDVGYTTGTFAFTGNYTSNIAELSYTHGTAVFTQGEVVYLGNNNANPSYIGLNGEL